jgi:hypothetical protein
MLFLDNEGNLNAAKKFKRSKKNDGKMQATV